MMENNTKTTTIYTTQRCILVKESYELIAECLRRKEQRFIELTETLFISSGFPDFKTITRERKILIQPQFIVEVVS